MGLIVWDLVDYILFITADVDVTPNPNEIRDHKYVSKEELQTMFDDPGQYMKYHNDRVWTLTFVTRSAANSFTPWFKLIARDFLFGWWDTLMARSANGIVSAKTLAGVADGSKVIKMV